MTLRSPVISVLGHVDHGKSSILDKIRGTGIVAREAGGITQAIGASIIPLNTIKDICGSLLDNIKNLSIPGLLFIDTPGHAAFTSLRKRGGSLADIAILVVDINEGFKPQTLEAVEILRASKTPFVVAANKLDIIPGYHKQKDMVLGDIAAQRSDVVGLIEKRLYELVEKFYKIGMKAERFDRVTDYAKELAIVPVSARTGAGLPELLMIICALTQKYLEGNLNINPDDPGRGTVLEIKEETGLGRTIDLILYDGCIKVNDTIVVGTMNEPVVTHVRSLLQPKAHQEMMDKKSKYDYIKEAYAATGVKVAGPELDDVISGMPLVVVRDFNKIAEVKAKIKSEVQDISISLDEEGIIVKADNVGSLEATVTLLREHGIKIRKVGVGKISKRDFNEVLANLDKGNEYAVILGFNIEEPKGTIPEGVSVFTNTVVYKLIEDYVAWDEDRKKKAEQVMLDVLARPFKIKVLPKCIFRQSHPLVCGVEVVAGILKPNIPLLKSDLSRVPAIKSLEANKKTQESAKAGEQLAIAVPGAVAEKHVFEGDVLYSNVPEEDFKKLKLLKKLLTPDEIDVLKEIAEMHRKQNSVWGI